MGSIIFVNFLSQMIAKIMLPMLKPYTNYGFHELFQFQLENLTYILKWQSVIEMHVIRKSTNLHVYSCFS